jgi:hypothetical protein
MKHLFAPICAFHVFAVGYEVYHHPPFLLTGLQSIGYKCELFHLINITYGFIYRLRIFCVHMSFCTPLSKAKFCGVPPQAIVKVGCAVD